MIWALEIELLNDLLLHAVQLDRLVATDKIGDVAAHASLRALEIGLEGLDAPPRDPHHGKVEEEGGDKRHGDGPVPQANPDQRGNQQEQRLRAQHGELEKILLNLQQRRPEKIAVEFSTAVSQVKAEAQRVDLRKNWLRREKIKFSRTVVKSRKLRCQKKRAEKGHPKHVGEGSHDQAHHAFMIGQTMNLQDIIEQIFQRQGPGGNGHP